MPRTARRLAALLLAGATLVSLTACAPGEATSTPSPSPAETDAPIFASDEEALAAAVAAYEKYLRVSEEIARGTAVAERILSVSTEEYGVARVSELTAFTESGLRLEGSYAFDTTSLVERSGEDSIELVRMYACQDVSGTRLINAEGADVTPADRDTRVPLVVSVELDVDSGLVAGSELWSGQNFC